MKNDKQWFELLVLLILLNHLKNLEEPEWKKNGTPLQSCKKDVEWMDIGLKKWTVSIGILRRKIYPSICYNIFLVIIKCCCGNTNTKTCHSITESAIEVIPRKRNAEIRNKPGTKIWNLLCFGIQNLLKVESGIQQLESRIHSVESRI